MPNNKLRMDNGKAQLASESNKRAVMKKRASPEDDCSQIDSIIGQFGLYQFMIFLFKILIGATSAFNNLGVTFYAPSDFVSFWCADNQQIAANASAAHHYASSNNSLSLSATTTTTTTSAANFKPWSVLTDQTHFGLLPTSRNGSESVGQIFSDFLFSKERAERHESALFNSDTPRNLRKECTYLSPLDNMQHKCKSYQYDTGIWLSTIIDEWNLVCDRSVFVSISQSLYMSGFIVAYLIFGYLSDRFGRWRSLVLGAFIEIMSGFGCAFANSPTQFLIFRFLLGLGNAGRSSSSYLMMIEWTGQRWRMHVSTLGSLGWAIGYCMMPWISMFFLHFRHMQLFVCFFESALFIWLLRLPESPRWLLTHKRFDEAYKELLRAAKFNGLIRKGTNNGTVKRDDCAKSSSSESLAVKSSLLYQASSDSTKQQNISNNHTIIGDGQFARKRLNSMSVNNNNNNNNNNHQPDNSATQAASVSAAAMQLVDVVSPPKVLIPTSPILAPHHEVATHVEVGMQGSQPNLLCGAVRSNSSSEDDDENDNKNLNKQTSSSLPKQTAMEPYSMAEFDVKFAKLAKLISQKEFTKNEDKLSFIDLFRWSNLRNYTFILAFAWSVNSFIYYGIALRVGDFGGKNLFVSFSFAGITEIPSMIFTIICMKCLPRRTTNIFLFSTIFLLCAIQVPMKYYDFGDGWIQQTTMILAKLFNSCSFTCILYQTMELFPTSIRQTAYSSCALAGRFGSILAPFVKELSQLTNNLVPPTMYAILSLVQIILIRHLPETQGTDLPDTLLEAERFKGTDKQRPKDHHKLKAFNNNNSNNNGACNRNANGVTCKVRLPPA